MKPERVVRENVRTFTDLPNIGPASARDFALLGFAGPHELAGADPLEIYHALCRATASYQDPCVLDVFMSVTDFLAGNPPRPWWDYTKRGRRHTVICARAEAGSTHARHRPCSAKPGSRTSP